MDEQSELNCAESTPYSQLPLVCMQGSRDDLRMLRLCLDGAVMSAVGKCKYVVIEMELSLLMDVSVSEACERGSRQEIVSSYVKLCL